MNVKELRDYLAQYQDNTPVMINVWMAEGPSQFKDLDGYWMRLLGDQWDENFKLYIG